MPAAAAPTTMDQVVDRAIEREHALITFLEDAHAAGRNLSAEPASSIRRWARRPSRTTISSAAWT